MAGLFDFDPAMLAQMFNPMGTANAAEGGAFSNTGGITPEQLINSQAALRAPPEGGEINPNPVQPGTIPLPRPAPPELSAPPAAIAGANRGIGAVPVQPGIPPGSVGAALRGESEQTGPAQGPTPSGEPVSGTSGSTDISAQAKSGEAARPSLAQALKGVTAPAAPVQQKISSPNAPRATGTIKSGELQALLMALNAGGGGTARPVRLGG